MVVINLLPWRIHQKSYENKAIKTILLLSIVITVMGLVAAHELLSRRLHFWAMRVDHIKQELKTFSDIDQKIEKENQNHVLSVGAEKKGISPLDLKHLFFSLGQKKAMGLCLTELSHEKNHFIFSGETHTAFELTQFLMHWKAATLFSEIEIKSLKQRPDQENLQFQFQAELRNQ